MSSPFHPSNKNKILIFLAFLSFALYFNTLLNEYALDDDVVIVKNKYTRQGINGIPELVTHHLFYGTMNDDSRVGLYRPLSLISFALEYEVFGLNPFVSHLVNVLLYVLIAVLLFQWMTIYIFRENIFLCFLVCLIFIIHPIHTEAVANIKSRDELLSLLFILISQIWLGKFLVKNNKNYLLLSTGAFTLALFSKESAITFIPVSAMILYFFFDQKLKSIAKTIIPFIMAAMLYITIKIILTGFTTADNESVLNTPYLYATPSEAFATKVFILVKYIYLLFFPHPLSYDYCYKQIPYINLSDIKFIFSSILLSGLLIFSLLKFRSKNIYSFSILFFFFTISTVSNFIFIIGAPMGERFLFLPSLGFAIVLGYFFYNYLSKNTYRTPVAIAFISVIFFGGYKTISRNFDWKDNTTLFIKDYYAAPNSIRVMTNAAAYSYYYQIPQLKDSILIKKLTEGAVSKLEKAIRTDPKFTEPYVHLTYIYLQDNKKELAVRTVELAIENNAVSLRLENFFPEISNYYVEQGRQQYLKREFEKCLSSFNRALFFNPNNYEAYWNLGGIYLEKREISKTIEYWEKTLQINPDQEKRKELLERVKNDFKGRN
jgi:tetratricopeptide (TPR) repeat protein